ncbi:MAG: polymer-forming cytoskeletal protein [Lachnospiraceae bacterium]|nr:polymer-forming cytoskeletal protein [Lachnospiraceae bacterium]
MMGRNKNTNSGADARTKIGTIIGKGAVFDGNITAPETIRIDGTLNGNCDCKEQLILGTDGQIKGDITAQNVIISGKVEGDIVVNGKLELLSTGKLTGNITARSLVIDEDACFDGRCTMTTNSADGTNTTTYSASKDEKQDKDNNNSNNSNDSNNSSENDKNKKKY